MASYNQGRVHQITSITNDILKLWESMERLKWLDYASAKLRATKYKLECDKAQLINIKSVCVLNTR